MHTASAGSRAATTRLKSGRYRSIRPAERSPSDGRHIRVSPLRGSAGLKGPGDLASTKETHFNNSCTAFKLALVLALVWAMANAKQASANVWVAPHRPLSDREQTEYSAGRADGIVQITFLGIIDTTTIVRGIPDSLARFRAVLGIPHRWLKGAGRLSPILIGISEFDASCWSLLNQVKPGTGLTLFLRRLPQTSDATPRSALDLPLSTAIDWYVNCGPNDWHRGVATYDSPEQRDQLVSRVRTALTMQSIDSLIVHADLIVQARITRNSHMCQLAQHAVPCLQMQVAKVIQGNMDARDLEAYTVFPAGAAVSNGIVFLRRGQDGLWEVLGLRGEGIMSLEGNMIVPAHISLDELTQKVARYRRGGAK